MQSDDSQYLVVDAGWTTIPTTVVLPVIVVYLDVVIQSNVLGCQTNIRPLVQLV